MLFSWILEIQVESPCEDDVDKEGQEQLAWLVLKQALDAVGIDGYLVLVGSSDDVDTFARVRKASPAYT